ncbi:MAG: endoglucanase, partial [Anaerolineales bacterium]
HMYPQANGVALSPAGSAANQQLRLRSTRSLWDPTYVDESWIGEPVNLIPRMRAWVAADYPGTRLAVTEYNWGALDHLNGALAEADVLGIFGREGVDLAALWDPPSANQPGAFALRMYRNYDGAHHRFGDTGVQAASADQSIIAIYAARRASDGALTLMVINKTPSSSAPLTSTVSLSGFAPAPSALVYRYSGANLHAIMPQPSQVVTASGFTATFPGASITLFVIQPGVPLTPRAYVPAVAR